MYGLELFSNQFYGAFKEKIQLISKYHIFFNVLIFNKQNYKKILKQKTNGVLSRRLENKFINYSSVNTVKYKFGKKHCILPKL